MKSTEKDFDPNPISRSDLGCWEAELLGKFVLKMFFTTIAYIQNDQRIMQIFLGYVCWRT